MIDYGTLKQPPNSIEAEQAVLSAVITDNRAYHRLNGIITAEDFFNASHKALWRRMDAMALQSVPMDAVSLIDSLQDAGELEKAGGVDYIGQLASEGRGSANVMHYALTIRDRRIQRELIQIGYDIADSGYQPGKLEGKIDEAQRLVMSLEVRKSNDPRHISDVMRSAVDVYEEATKADGGIVGMPTGFRDLDKRMGGMMPEDLIIVAGRPSMGKSVFAMNVAEHAAMQGNTVLVFSLEMSSESLAMRSMASVGHCEYKAIKSGSSQPDVVTGMTAGVAKIKDRDLYLDDNPTLTSQQLASRARKLSQKLGKPIDLVVVDYLQLLSDKGEGTERVTKMSRALKLAAKDLRCPIVALSQLNRGVEHRQDKRPLMSDLRESGAIEQDADTILMLYRDEVYNEDTNQKGVAEVLIRKLRNGEIGTVYLSAMLNQMRFADMAHPYTPPLAPPRKKSTFADLD